MVSQGSLQFFFKLLHQESGLILDQSKKYLIETRLEPIAVQEGFKDIDGLARDMMTKRNSLVRQKVVDAMTTNETSFFRDVTPFNTLVDEVMPEMMKHCERSKKIRIWCAASSTGQEPYSIAMKLADMGSKLNGWTVQIIATDIAQHVLDKAKVGLYTQHEAQRGLPTPYMMRFMEKNGPLNWKVKPEIKKMVTFRKLNILSPLGSIGETNIIFCRNILIYFDVKTKKGVVERMSKILAPNGILFLGGSETLLGISGSLTRISAKKGSYYQKLVKANSASKVAPRRFTSRVAV
ncbi:MAG: CheR family methyltransferase [Nitrospiria bacterium]